MNPDELAGKTKAELLALLPTERNTKDEILAAVTKVMAPPPEPPKTADHIAERDIRIQSPAGPVHLFHGFVDDGTGAIVIQGLPEDEIGHWDPFYALTVNEQDLGRAQIVARGEGDGGA